MARVPSKKSPSKRKAKAKAAPAKPKRTKMTEAEKKANTKAKNKLVQQTFAEMGADSPHFFQWLKGNVLRLAFRRWPAYYALYSKETSKRVLMPTANGTMRWMSVWQCAECGLWFPRKCLAVDHKQAIGRAPRTPEEVGETVVRMFCRLTEVQLLCNYKNDDKRFKVRSCHKIKTQEERATK